MYRAVENYFNELEGASVADRVVGRAAALLNVYSKVSAVYSDIISENALELMGINHIHVLYKTSVSGIQNREKNDACPIEKISSKVKDDDCLVCFYNYDRNSRHRYSNNPCTGNY